MANKPRPPGRRQDGALIMIFAMALMVLIGFMGMALDLAQVYNRKTELQNIADVAALAAAQELNGSALGIASAVAKAKSSAAGQSSYRHQPQGAVLSDESIKFAASADAAESEWHAQGAVPDVAEMLFVKIDTGQNTPALGSVGTFFMGALSSNLATAHTSGRAVAGRSSLRLTPLAVCAMSPLPAAARNNPGPPARVEAVEYGFRRGVGYNLLNLNPSGAAPANYLLNPIDPLNSMGSAAHVAPAAVAPFVCAGRMPLARIGGARIHAHAPFPGALSGQLNSRFNLYAGTLCNPRTAPPDSNIKLFNGSGSSWWMTNAPDGPSAAPAAGSPLRTVADIEPPVPPTVTAGNYGPLWSFAKAAQYAAVKPVGDYLAFATSNWAQLYPSTPAAPAANGLYGLPTPYQFNIVAPVGNPGLAQRRVLNIALLACPLPAGADVMANVLGIGKFFMTAPATASMISAEFAGLVAEQALGGPVELQQ